MSTLTSNPFGDTGTIPGARGNEIRWLRHHGGNVADAIFDTATFAYEGRITTSGIMAVVHDGKNFGAACNIHQRKLNIPVDSVWFEGPLLAANVYAVWAIFNRALKGMKFPGARRICVGSNRKRTLQIWSGERNKGFVKAIRPYLAEPCEVNPAALTILEYGLPEKQRSGKIDYQDRPMPPDWKPMPLAEQAFVIGLDVTWYRTVNHGEIKLAWL